MERQYQSSQGSPTEKSDKKEKKKVDVCENYHWNRGLLP